MFKPSAAIIAFALLSCFASGCNSDPEAIRPVTLAVPLAPATTRPAVVAEMAALKISRTDLDEFLYRSYGLRMLFDLAELGLAKSTLQQQGGGTLTSADVERERKLILAKICGDASPADYGNLFEQFLQQEHMTHAEFEVKVVETNACLRKILEPMIIGKVPEEKVHRAFDQLYGAKRRIADITLDNIRDANLARELTKTQPFAQVALQMSVDRETAVNGGEWPPFSSQHKEIPQEIRDIAFSSDVGQISDIIATADKFHIIKVLEAISPKIVKYETVKDSVRKQLEDTLIEADIKRLREATRQKAQQLMQIDDPILKKQWDDLKSGNQPKSVDPRSVGSRFDQQRAKASTVPATVPSTVPAGQ